MEIWKDIPWYEGFYQASTLSKIRSLPRRKLHSTWKKYFIKKGKILNDRRSNIIYKEVILYKDWRKRNFRVHRLVASCFLWLNLEDTKMLVCHKKEKLDEKWFLDNSKDNLFLGNHKDNSQDRDRKWRFIAWNTIKIAQYSLEWIFIKNWDSINSTWISHIREVIDWKRKTAWGFIWKLI